jgi:ABC-type antimicrobial peptide transport system ATPase subunit
MARRPPPLIPNISDYLLEVRELTMDLTKTSGAVVRAVEAVSFSIPRDRTLALVGECSHASCGIARNAPGMIGPVGDVGHISIGIECVPHGQATGINDVCC